MSGVKIDNSPALATRKQDISSWKDGDISTLNSSEKKSYYRRKSAVKAYFTTLEPLDQIAQRYHFRIRTLEKLVEGCTMLHEDNTPWGLRALVPGVRVSDYTPRQNEGADQVQEEPRKEESDDFLAGAENAPGASTPSDEDDVEVTTKRTRIIIPQDDHAPQEDVPEFVEGEEPAGDLAQDTVKDAASAADSQISEEPTSADVEGREVVDETSLSSETVEEPAVVENEATTIIEANETETLEIGPSIEPIADEAETSPLETAMQPVGNEKEASQVAGERTDPLLSAMVTSNLSVFYIPEFPRRGSRALLERTRLLPFPLEARFVTAPTKAVTTKRSVRKHWVRSMERAHKRRVHRIVAITIVAVIFLSLLIPVGMGIAAYSAYTSIKGVALDGVNHLMTVKDLLPISKTDPLAALDPKKLQQAGLEFSQAQSDFLQLQELVDRQDIQNAIEQFTPQFGSKLDMAQRLVQVGIDVTRMGNELIGVAMLGANVLHSSPLATGSAKPLLTVNDISNIEGTMLHTLYYIQDIRAQMSQVSLNQLPISVSQQKLITSAMTELPKVQSYIEQGQGLIGIASWLLGVGQGRHFLVQTMDSAEIRPGGGFTGQYGVLSIQNGRVAPFTLQDVTELDYNGNGFELGRQAPRQYLSWMNFGNFGLRDSNLSGDYPTTAQLAMQVFQQEGGGPVDGDIAFTPLAISHVLDITGPIKVQEYNDTITAQNLEDKLHYYQQNPTAIALQREKTGTNNAATRKSFTSLLGKLLLEKLRQLPVKSLVKVVENAQKDIKSRDLEIYFTNPQAENWLIQHNLSGAMNTFSKVDGFMVVQSNISISKASQYVQTTEQDNVVLDARGGATHNLTITLNYQQKGPVYGYDTYADYIRVYAPANAQLLGGDGFDSGKALCVPSSPGSTSKGTKANPSPPTTSSCGQYASYFPGDERYCPNGNYSLGQRGYVEGKGFTNWPVDSLSGPTELTSDLPGRAMWGGLTVTPKNCISYISLSWYVPNAVKHVVGQPLYSVLVQKQGGYVPIVQISIDTSALKGVKPYQFQGGILADRLFALPVVKK